MPGLDWSPLAMDDLLGFGLSVLMVLMALSLAFWFACSIVGTIAKMGRQTRHPNRDTLLRENRRLRDSLADAQAENYYLRKLYRNDPPPRAEDGRQNAA